MASTPQQSSNPATIPTAMPPSIRGILAPAAGTVTTSCADTSPVTDPSSSSSSTPTGSRLYFAYGSNLSTTQMASRCPGARPLHLAWLGGWRFIINTRGVANIVPDDSDAFTTAASNRPVTTGSEGSSPGVYGILYEIDADDEESLDLCEGVPFVYEKVEMGVCIAPLRGEGAEKQFGVRLLLLGLRLGGGPPWRWCMWTLGGRRRAGRGGSMSTA